MIGCKAAKTPMELNLKLEAAKPENQVDQEQYQRLVGKLTYLAHTRPNISFAVNMVSQFMHSPGPEHYEAAIRILRYLRGLQGRNFCLLTEVTFKLKSLQMQIGLAI